MAITAMDQVVVKNDRLTEHSTSSINLVCCANWRVRYEADRVWQASVKKSGLNR
jgi:hypothetical protein